MLRRHDRRYHLHRRVLSGRNIRLQLLDMFQRLHLRLHWLSERLLHANDVQRRISTARLDIREL